MKNFLVLLTIVAASTSIFGQQPSTEPRTTGIDAVTPKLIAKPPIGKIAFVCQSMLGENPFVYVLDYKGTLARISKGSSPGFSSDGKKLIYSYVDGGITTRDLMTNASAPLIPGVFAGRLSPDSKRLLSASFNHLTQNSLLEIVDIKTGTKTTLLSEEGGGFLSSPAWSPNGNKILFTSGRGMLVPSSEGFQIWSMNADGKSASNMSNNGEGCNNAVWSPDGSRVAWDSQTIKLGKGRNGIKVFDRGPESIVIAKSDGSEQNKLPNKGSRDTYPAWSPDGQWIAFVSDNYSAKTSGIWISKVDGGDRRQITENMGEVIAVGLRWSK